MSYSINKYFLLVTVVSIPQIFRQQSIIGNEAPLSSPIHIINNPSTTENGISN